MRRASRLASALLALLLAPAAEAGPLPPDTVAAIEAAIATEMAEKNLPSVAIGIRIPGRGDYVAAMGKADLATGAPRSPGDPFRIGSVTKAMIGTVVLQLAGEGKLALGDPIARWFPDFPDADRITVDDLLRMRSGIWDSWTEAALGAFYADPLHPPGIDEMIARSAAGGARFTAPDSATVYVNMNYLLLDRIVSLTTGQSTAAVLKARIFDPLGMTASELPEAPGLPGPLHGYGWNPATGAYEDKTELDPRPVGGAGAAISTLADLDVFLRALCTGTQLSPEAQAARTRYQDFAGTGGAAGYGEALARLGPFCGHNGTIMGFSTEAWYLPAEDATVVINVSRLDADDRSMSGDLFGRIGRILFPAALK